MKRLLLGFSLLIALALLPIWSSATPISVPINFDNSYDTTLNYWYAGATSLIHTDTITTFPYSGTRSVQDTVSWLLVTRYHFTVDADGVYRWGTQSIYPTAALRRAAYLGIETWSRDSTLTADSLVGKIIKAMHDSGAAVFGATLYDSLLVLVQDGTGSAFDSTVVYGAALMAIIKFSDSLALSGDEITTRILDSLLARGSYAFSSAWWHQIAVHADSGTGGNWSATQVDSVLKALHDMSIAAKVWRAVKSGYVAAGTMGELLNNAGDLTQYPTIGEFLDSLLEIPATDTTSGAYLLTQILRLGGVSSAKLDSMGWLSSNGPGSIAKTIRGSDYDLVHMGANGTFFYTKKFFHTGKTGGAAPDSVKVLPYTP